MNAYADDISMFIDDERMLERVAEAFSSFESASGALLNQRKTSAIMIGNVNLTCDSEWLNIENFVEILGITFGENMNQACKMSWERVIRGIRIRLWFHNPRKLNLIQKVILINTYICSKLWYMASNITISKGFIKKIKSELGKFIWHGQPLQRISFTNLTLPKERGGLNLHCPELKSKSLLMNRLIKLVQHLPFTRNLLENANLTTPSMCGHITMLRNHLPDIPDNLLETLSSTGLYKHYISLHPEPGFVAAESREWKTIFKNIHSNFLSAKHRSAWFVVAHRKIRHRELFFLRNVTEDPYCSSCPGETETVVHKLFDCYRVRDIWEYQRRLRRWRFVPAVVLRSSEPNAARLPTSDRRRVNGLVPDGDGRPAGVAGRRLPSLADRLTQAPGLSGLAERGLSLALKASGLRVVVLGG